MENEADGEDLFQLALPQVVSVEAQIREELQLLQKILINVLISGVISVSNKKVYKLIILLIKSTSTVFSTRLVPRKGRR